MRRQRISQDHPDYRDHLADRREAFREGDRESWFSDKEVTGSLYRAGYFYEGLAVHEQGDSPHPEETFSPENIHEHAELVREMAKDEGLIRRLALMLTSDRRFTKSLEKRGVIKNTFSLGAAVKHDIRRLLDSKISHYSPNRVKSARQIEQVFQDGEDAVLLEVAARAVEMVEQRREQVEQIFPEMKRRFIERITPMIKSKRYPITLEMAKKRIEDLSVVVGFAQDERWGGMVDRERTGIFVSVFEVNEGHEEEIIMHELMHALAGSSVHVELDEHGQPEGFDVVRAGLRDGGQFSWLNEAVTEQETLNIMGKSDSWAYQAERALLKALQLEGKFLVPDSVFLDAYFFSSGEYEEDEIAWDLMKRSVDKSFAPGFFDRLNASLQTLPMSTAIRLLAKKRWREIYDIGQRNMDRARKIEDAVAASMPG